MTGESGGLVITFGGTKKRPHAPATSVPRPRPRRRCVRSPHRDRDADAALGHAIALGYAQGPGAWGANHIIMPDGARFSMLEADPMKLTYY